MAGLTNCKGTEDLVVGKIHGAWRCDGKLGSGAFGIIHVWSNIKDDLVEKSMKNSKMAKYDDINETSKDIPDLEFCRMEQKQTSDNIKVGVS